MSILLSHAGTAMTTSPAAAREILVATMDGVQTLKKTGEGRWEQSARALAGKHIQSIIEAPGGTLFACAYRDGVYASEDGGASWSARDSGITIRNVYSLAAATVDGRVRLYAGTEPANLFVSDDMGRSWRELSDFRKVPGVEKWTFVAEPFKGHAKHIGFDPNNPRVIYVCVEVGALLKSSDGGETWASLPIPNPDMHRTVIDPRDSRRVYTTGGAGVLITTDDGRTWRTLLARMSNPVGEYADQLVRSQSNPDVMLMGATQFSPRTWIDRMYAGTALAKSVDGGETWRILRGGLPERITASIEAMTQVESPDGIEYFFGTTDGEIWHGDQDGERWACIARIAPVSKCIHQEMLTGKPVTQLVHADGQRRPVHAPSP